MLDLHRDLFKDIEKFIGRLFSFLPITPNQWTLSSILFILVCFCFLVKQNLLLSLIFFLVASFLDFVDGAVARYKNLASKKGAYLDTICDRYVEALLLFGILFIPLPRIIAPSFIWIFLILFGSMMTTYAKAAAKEKKLIEQELKGGLLSRAERIILFLFILISGLFSFTWMTYLLIFMAILTNITAVQRIIWAIEIKN